MKQDKGRGIIVLDRSKNTEKYLNIPQTEQFTKLRHDPTKSIENKIQQELKKLKRRLTIRVSTVISHRLKPRYILWHCKTT